MPSLHEVLHKVGYLVCEGAWGVLGFRDDVRSRNPNPKVTNRKT